MKNVLITGGAGFIGSNIAKKMAENGYRVSATYHLTKPRCPIDHVSYIQADLLDSKQCQSVMEQQDIVIMCAAYVGGIAHLQTNPLALLNDTTRINLNTLEAAYRHRVKKCIFFSSGAVYPKLNRPAEESDGFTKNPIDKYFMLGWSKRFGEILCQSYSQKVEPGMDITVLRIDNIYGPYDTFEGNKAHVVPSLIRKAVKNRNPIVVWGDGEEKKDFLFAEDLAEAVLKAVEKCQGYHTYNVVYGENATINHVLEQILEINGNKDFVVEHDLTKPTSVSERNLDCTKIAEELGFHAKTGIREGLEKTILWYKEHHE